MPELPEVETVCRALDRLVRGKTVKSVKLLTPKIRFAVPPRIKTAINDYKIVSVERRAKYILLHFICAHKPALTILAHLGMTGQFTVVKPNHTRPPAKHDHLDILCSDGTHIIFNDPRRFGLIDIGKTNSIQVHKLLKPIGAEPFDKNLTPTNFHLRLAKTRAPIKSTLLDQRFIAGVGNIYANEALYLAHIHPLTPANKISKEKAAVLLKAIRQVLRAAIKSGGSTLLNYKSADGLSGQFQHHFKVYDKESTNCPLKNCSGTIKRTVIAGRSTFFCPQHQKKTC